MNLQEFSPMEIWLLNVIYDLGEPDVYEILDRIASEKDWKYTTVLTIATRLSSKGYLKRKKVGRRHVFKPTITRAKAFELAMNKLYGNTLLKEPGPVISYLIKSRKISKKDKDALKRLLK